MALSKMLCSSELHLMLGRLEGPDSVLAGLLNALLCMARLVRGVRVCARADAAAASCCLCAGLSVSCTDLVWEAAGNGEVLALTLDR